MSYVIFYRKDGGKMYLTDLPDDDNPFSGIGFQGGGDNEVPISAGSCPTIEDAEKVIAYLNEDQDGYYEQHEFFYEEDPREQ